ncbi:Esterase SG1, partial [Gryllus bimaculatus]
QGALRGRRDVSVAGCAYYSFQGIPYAQPPVGALRFKDSLPPAPWKGIRDAVQEGSICPQGRGDDIKGHEDCLFVSVYTPRRPSVLGDPLPVLVWIHGGGFEAGSADEFGPDYLICEDIVMVTLNYRLGPLGFLHLDEAAPGNAGLKDQMMALRWVQ